MYEDPLDMFREMDALFARFYPQMTRGLMTGELRVSGYRMVMMGGEENQTLTDSREIPVQEISDPGAEVHRIGDEVIVVTEVPGATSESIDLRLKGSVIRIDADGGSVQYQARARLPPVDPGSMQTSLKNGVLEVTFRSLPCSGEEKC